MQWQRFMGNSVFSLTCRKMDGFIKCAERSRVITEKITRDLSCNHARSFQPPREALWRQAARNVYRYAKFEDGMHADAHHIIRTEGRRPPVGILLPSVRFGAFASCDYFCLSKSRISVSSVSSADGAGGAAGASSSFLRSSLLMAFIITKMQKAMMMKLTICWMKFP